MHVSHFVARFREFKELDKGINALCNYNLAVGILCSTGCGVLPVLFK